MSLTSSLSYQSLLVASIAQNYAYVLQQVQQQSHMPFSVAA